MERRSPREGVQHSQADERRVRSSNKLCCLSVVVIEIRNRHGRGKLGKTTVTAIFTSVTVKVLRYDCGTVKRMTVLPW